MILAKGFVSIVATVVTICTKHVLIIGTEHVLIMGTKYIVTIGIKHLIPLNRHWKRLNNICML